MLRRFSVLLIFIGSLIPSVGQAGIDLSGAIRNDAMLLERGGQSYFFDVLENQLLFQRRTPEWRFYADLRVFLYYGDFREYAPELYDEGDLISLEVLRGFIRYYSDYGDITVGKTYLNFGVYSVFNPFEIDRNVNFRDLSYTKEGILALSYEVPFDAVSGAKLFISPEGGETDVAAGASVYTNLESFDIGLVAQRRDRDRNVVGAYLKGDLEVGVQAAYAWTMQDDGGDGGSEANIGVDYSLLDGQIMATALFYYNDRPTIAAAPNTLSALGDLGQLETTSDFPDRYYVYANLAYTPDEFFRASLDAFVNASDGSSLIIPSATWVLADGLNFTILAMVPTGGGDTQYSRDLYGEYAGIMRIEAKL